MQLLDFLLIWYNNRKGKRCLSLENIKKKLYIAVMCLALSGMAACGKRQEAVISADGEELTEAVKEYDKLSVSMVDKFYLRT